jgi:branched-subunit amino acid transport protein
MTWIAVVVCAVGCYAFKIAGLSLPARTLDHRLVQRIGDLIPLALLGALIAVQVFAHGARLVVDARLAGLAAAVVALLIRAPFLVVVAAAALTAALLRMT